MHPLIRSNALGNYLHDFATSVKINHVGESANGALLSKTPSTIPSFCKHSPEIVDQTMRVGADVGKRENRITWRQGGKGEGKKST
tara:strand:- start:737 stop:991 length:255 start_codon:yes stop_codon:yes gene_type:complete